MMPKSNAAERAQLLIDAYREELRRLYGDKRPDEADLSYQYGWFGVRHRVGRIKDHYQRAEFESLIEELKKRRKPKVFITERSREGSADA